MKLKRPVRIATVCGALILALTLTMLGGCGSNSKSSVITGKVSYNGAPVTGGSIKFYPEGKTEPAGGGPISPDGTFSFGGIPLGKMKVVVETDSIKNVAKSDYTKTMKPPEGVTPPPGMTSRAGAGAVYVQIPAKYSKPENTDLTCEVKGGTTSLDLKLVD